MNFDTYLAAHYSEIRFPLVYITYHNWIKFAILPQAQRLIRYQVLYIIENLYYENFNDIEINLSLNFLSDISEKACIWSPDENFIDNHKEQLSKILKNLFIKKKFLHCIGLYNILHGGSFIDFELYNYFDDYRSKFYFLANIDDDLIKISDRKKIIEICLNLCDDLSKQDLIKDHDLVENKYKTDRGMLWLRCLELLKACEYENFYIEFSKFNYKSSAPFIKDRLEWLAK
jgi:hypothetical protein